MRYIKIFEGTTNKVEKELNAFYIEVEEKQHRVLVSKMSSHITAHGYPEIVVLLVVDEYRPPRRHWERGHGGDSSVTVSEHDTDN